MCTKKSQWIQAGGHGGPQQLIPEGPYLYKPVLSVREKNFYEGIQTKADWVSSGVLPRFFGIEKREYGYGEFEYIKMENLLYGYRRPFVLDLKIGTQTWDGETIKRKLKKRLEVDATSTTAQLGIRFSGMERNVTGDKPILYSRYLCTRDITCRASLLKYIRLFFNDGKRDRYDLLPVFIERVKAMIELMSADEYRMFSTSVLFIYDADAELADGRHNCKMIDYAHTWHLATEHCDEEDGFLFGLRSLLSMLTELRDESLIDVY